MSHTPFILMSYGIGALVLAWTAISPLIRKKAVLRDIAQLRKIEERSRDANT